jgi:hypothetical protein
MLIRDLYHGSNGDNILSIISDSAIAPNTDGKVYFSEWRFDSVLMHGADRKRKATFAVKLRVWIPETAVMQQDATPGVADTLVVTPAEPLRAEVLELYVREARATTVKTIKGKAAIRAYLAS